MMGRRNCNRTIDFDCKNDFHYHQNQNHHQYQLTTIITSSGRDLTESIVDVKFVAIKLTFTHTPH